jgi:uncharacterized protein (TIGR03435 family)
MRMHAVVATLGFVVASAVIAAQESSAPESRRAFEVASVKQNRSGSQMVLMGFPPGGRFNATNVTLKQLIASAYGTPQVLPQFRIIGGPPWIDSDRFDVTAKADTDFAPTPGGPPAPLFEMLRSLLADRFKLVVHNETRDLPVYDLVLARADGKLGSQMQKSAVDCVALAAARRGGAPPPAPAPGERPPCGVRMSPATITGGAVTMPQLVTVLSQRVGRTVVDKTGLTGSFDIDLAWTPEQLPTGTPPPGAPPLPPIDPNGPSIFTALQEQLGLKLDSTKGPVDVVVIDSVEHPTED